jgi:hypothetical protein
MQKFKGLNKKQYIQLTKFEIPEKMNELIKYIYLLV